MRQRLSNFPPRYMLIVVFRSIYALNRVRDKISYCAGLQASKRSKVWMFLVCSGIWRNLRKTVVPFPAQTCHVTSGVEDRMGKGVTSCPKVCVFFATCFAKFLRFLVEDRYDAYSVHNCNGFPIFMLSIIFS